ncbi:MAG: zinc-dependent metalloprotease, partial [Phycisphaerae bacterium]
QLGPSRLISFRDVGGKLLVEQQNVVFRAVSESADEHGAVRDSFATSVLWAGPFETRDADGRLLVDITSLVLRDAHRIASRLKRTQQGSFSLDTARSAVDTRNCLALPDNIELEGLLTFTSSEPGQHVMATTPEPTAVTLTVHHSLIRLPDGDYTPRRFDPRVACNSVSFVDFAAPLDEPLESNWILRHRLKKVDPTAPRSRPVEPIVYYVDRGAPEPIKQALIDGASWWNEAFERIGFLDAFRVEELPEGAHPLDVRFNVIQWVHRSTRGWSYGGTIHDPRTGEILKGHVTLGSLRVRQDRRIFEGLAGTQKTGSGDADDPIELALARIRQLSAHEVGHTLGFAHNFAASSYGRASVMDYPAPLVRVRDDTLDFSDAYAVGIGKWDTHCVRYAYADFPPGADEQVELEKIIDEGQKRQFVFVSDLDARPEGAAHPLANLWDNAADPVDELERLIDVRHIALRQFGRHNVTPGTPLDHLHETFVPVYLFHRYQVAAAVKTLGGLSYQYAVAGARQLGAQLLPPADQRRALQVLLHTIEPEFLDIPDKTLSVLIPRTFGSWRNREQFRSSTTPAFDPLGAASAAVDVTISLVLNPARCARLIDHHRRDATMPPLDEVVTALTQRAFAAPDGEPLRLLAIRQRVQHVLVARLIGLAQDEQADPAVRSTINDQLTELHQRMVASVDETNRPHARQLAGLIVRHLNRPFAAAPPTRAADPLPPGAPIGAGLDFMSACSTDGGAGRFVP